MTIAPNDNDAGEADGRTVGPPKRADSPCDARCRLDAPTTFPDDGPAPSWLGDMMAHLSARLVQCHRQAQRRVLRTAPMRLLSWGRMHLPAHFVKTPSAMHRWLAIRLDDMTCHRGVKLNVLAPRGSAKSTLGTLAFPMREALEGRERYIWIVSDTASQASAHLENIKTELLENAKLREVYPDSAGRGPVWRAGAVTLRNGVTIEAYGTGQRIRGRRRRADRPTLVVCDDLQNDDHMRSALLRERSRTWFHGTLLRAGTSHTNVVMLGTALHRDALAMDLTRTAGWRSRLFKAIRHWPDNMTLWLEWESVYANVADADADANARRFYDQHRDTMDAGASVLWPAEEDLYTLMCMRAQSGRNAFEREKQNSPIPPDDCEWPESYFDETLWFDAWPENLAVRTIAIDPSKGADARRGDYSAIVRLGIDRSGVLYVEADLARRNTADIVAAGVEAYRQFHPDAFGIESNQFQDLLGSQFDAEFARQGIVAPPPWLIDNHVNKRVRIRRIGPYLAARRLRMKAESPSTRLLVEQLREFPLGDHDDGPDALEMAVRLAAEMTAGTADDGLGNRIRIEP